MPLGVGSGTALGNAIEQYATDVIIMNVFIFVKVGERLLEAVLVGFRWH